MPNAFIGIDVMTGCRGEKKEFFEDAYHFINDLDVSQLHVFPYSERPGTAALKIPYVVGEKEKQRRTQLLLKLSERKTQAFYSAHIGEKAIVLFEKPSKGKVMHGFTTNYIRVELPLDEVKDEYDNKIMNVILGDFNSKKNALTATIIQ